MVSALDDRAQLAGWGRAEAAAYLRRVRWSTLTHAEGSARELPLRLVALWTGDDDEAWGQLSALAEVLTGHGVVHEATLAALPLLIARVLTEVVPMACALREALAAIVLDAFAGRGHHSTHAAGGHRARWARQLAEAGCSLETRLAREAQLEAEIHALAERWFEAIVAHIDARAYARCGRWDALQGRLVTLGEAIDAWAARDG